MKLKAKILEFLAGRPICMINPDTAKLLSVHLNERVIISKKNKKIISVVDTSSSLAKKNEIAVSNEIVDSLNLKKHDSVEVALAANPLSISLIKKKLDGKKLEKKEIYTIMQDIASGALTEVEIAFFVSAVHNSSMNMSEIKYLTDAMINTGKKIKLNGIVVDKHCIGGIAGNRTTPLVVSICAAAGLIMPKTSSRAITSAAGTADTIETLAKVDFSINEIKKIIKKTNACFVWGGALGLAPVDDKIIQVERTVNIDSTAQLLASILSKKISVGSKHILIDIPFGESAKVNKKEAEALKEKFLRLGRMFGLDINVTLTNGREPIGNGVGPALEMIDIIKILKRENGPRDLEEKALDLAGKLLEMAKKSKNQEGKKLAEEILDSKKAYEKFRSIIEAQKGKIIELKPGKYNYKIKAERNLKILHIDNKLLNSIARFAGCPEDKCAGIYLNKKSGDLAKKQEVLMTIYAESKEKLENAIKLYKSNKKDLVIFE